MRNKSQEVKYSADDVQILIFFFFTSIGFSLFPITNGIAVQFLEGILEDL